MNPYRSGQGETPVRMAWFALHRPAAATNSRGMGLEVGLFPGGRRLPDPDNKARWGMGNDGWRGQIEGSVVSNVLPIYQKSLEERLPNILIALTGVLGGRSVGREEATEADLVRQGVYPMLEADVGQPQCGPGRRVLGAGRRLPPWPRSTAPGPRPGTPGSVPRWPRCLEHEKQTTNIWLQAMQLCFS